MVSKKEKLVEITRSFSYKLNLGNYQTADFFCSEKGEVPEGEKVEASEKLYKFCEDEVMKSVYGYKLENGITEKREKCTKKDFVEAEKEALKLQNLQDQAEEVGEEIKREEELAAWKQ